MSVDGREPQAVSPEADTYSIDKALLRGETGNIDNLIFIKYVPYTPSRDHRGVLRRGRIKVVTQSGVPVLSKYSKYTRDLSRERYDGGFQVQAFDISAGNATLKVGDYRIKSHLAMTPEGESFFFTVVSANPIGYSRLEGVHTSEILRFLNEQTSLSTEPDQPQDLYVASKAEIVQTES